MRIDAKVVVLEYSDLQCPYCSDYAQRTYPTVNTRLIESGKIAYSYRHFPLLIHKDAEAFAEVVQCVPEPTLRRQVLRKCFVAKINY